MTYTNFKKLIGATALAAATLSTLSVPVSVSASPFATQHIGTRMYPHKDHGTDDNKNQAADANKDAGKKLHDQKQAEVAKDIEQHKEQLAKDRADKVSKEKQQQAETKEKNVKLHEDRQAQLAKEHADKLANEKKDRDKKIAEQKRIGDENKAKAEKLHQDKVNQEKVATEQRKKDEAAAKQKAADAAKARAEHNKDAKTPKH